jgi:hypothetical protein
MTPSLTVGLATDAASAGRERLGQADKLALGSVANDAPDRAPASCRIRSHEPAIRKPGYRRKQGPH